MTLIHEPSPQLNKTEMGAGAGAGARKREGTEKFKNWKRL